jgi:serpin B
MGRISRLEVVLMAVVLLVAGCGPTTPSPSPVSSAVASPPASAVPNPSAIPSTSPAPSGSGAVVGATARTVSDRLRVRSLPGVSADSIKYEPVLPVGTDLVVINGPVTASGYVWYDVAPVSFALSGGADHGWVAIGDHDGTPWVTITAPPIAGLDVATSAVARAAANPKDTKTGADSITAFGLDLYRRMLKDPALDLGKKNVVFSPTSIALALAMARAGANGDTAAQMDAVLHANGWDDLGSGLNALDLSLASRNGTYTDEEGATRSLALRITNASFGQSGWLIEPAYLDAIASQLGSGLRLVDYAADPEAARQSINAWVSRQTAARIPELLLRPDVTTQTRLYLVNAVYLKAEWERWFDLEGTKPAAFTRLDGSKVSVPMMHRTGSAGVGADPIPYVHGSDWRAVELRYRGPNESRPLAMTLIVPDEMTSFEAAVTPKKLGQITAALAAERARFVGPQTCPAPSEPGNCYPYDLNLSMPRFGIETRADLRDVLSAAGMRSAFDPVNADFSGIHVPSSADDRIRIATVIHQANIDVDEKGTEAAAATAVGMDTGGGPGPLKVINFRLDRPFLFVLHDVDTGAVLFMGRVVDPSIAR